MSHAGPMPRPDSNCRECGAVNDPGSSECWLCHCRNWRNEGRESMPLKPIPIEDTDGAWPIIAVLLGLLLIGGMALSPGLILAVLLFLLPAVIGAEWVARRRQKRGLPTSAARKIGCVLLLLIVIPNVLGFAIFVALWMVCTMGGGMNLR